MKFQIPSEIDFTDIINHIDIQANDTLVVFSDINKLALNYRQKGGFNVRDFIDSIQSKLTEGTLLVTSFSDNLKDGGEFDYQKTKPTTGALSKRVFRFKDFMRTKDPLHSFLVWGKRQKELTDLEIPSTFGKGSLFERIHQINAKMLLIDVDFQNSFTFIHYIEEMFGVSYRKPYKLNINVVNQNGDSFIKTIIFNTKKFGVDTYLNNYQKEVLESDSAKEYQFNNSKFYLIESKKVFDFTHRYLDEGGQLYKFKPKKFIKQVIKKIVGYKFPID
jgi:aminoglycoside 3-N-acetyltransferase